MCGPSYENLGQGSFPLTPERGSPILASQTLFQNPERKSFLGHFHVVR